MTQEQNNKNLQSPPAAEHAKSHLPALEEEVLRFWEKNKIFEKSVERPPLNLPLGKGEKPKEYVFYDGPPFATGTPHYGHIVASIMKDVVPRYWTMKGFRVERKWGWDCHGLPIENIVEKELGFKSKKDIEKLGIAKFNETCRSKVLGYVDEWKKTINRLGRWADMENAYKTMDLNYMESIWWVFKELWDKGLIYEGYRSMHICPRCETTLSQMEVAEGYKTVKDLSATVKFKLEPNQKIGDFTTDDNTYILAWTTTPWTLPGNVALAVGEDIEYVVVEIDQKVDLEVEVEKYGDTLEKERLLGGQYILAKNRFSFYQNLLAYSIDMHEGVSVEELMVANKRIKGIKSTDLIGKKYKPLFNYYSKDKNLDNRENGWKIYAADFVTTDEGTGVVHIAPAFGEDDMSLGKKYNLPFIQHVNMDGTFKDEVIDFAGRSVSPRAKNKPEEIREIDLEIVRFLGDNIFNSEKYEHSYPHCWRCDTPLLNYATSSWFVKITDIKDKALKLAKEINWVPAHIKEGRFGQWLEGARDWSISRQRFWASVIPIWKCQKCTELIVLGSVDELEKLSGVKITDLHKHVVDEITFKCVKCGGVMKRVPDVLDTWFDSGSMPYAQMHYPFENKEKFEQNFPAEFIAEGVDQTRAWFYYLHVIATAIKKKPAFKNVIVNGIVLAEDGKKMAKRLQNYPDPNEIMEKHGADKLRYYLCSSSVIKAEDLNFSENDLVEQTRFFNILLNVLSFYKMFAGDTKIENLEEKDLVNVLDKWITARLEETKKIVTEKMDNYDLHAIREIPVFINDLSTWYVRRSRERFKGLSAQASGRADEDKMRALKTLRRTLYHLARMMAPFMPFTAEHIYQTLGADVESVHLKPWPEVREEWIDEEVLENMEQVRKIAELGLAKRDEAGIKVKQPLNQLSIINYQLSMNEPGYSQLIQAELNVKEVVCKKGKGELAVELDTKITPELKLEGIKRELVRALNNLRKEAGMTIHERAVIYYQTASPEIKKAFEKFGEDIKKDTLSDEIKTGEGAAVKVDGEVVQLKVVKK
jgi:isoleucyl-tRNA synthetase